MREITLRKTETGDLATLFEFQKDEAANQMAAFTSVDPTDEAAFLDKWKAIITDPTKSSMTILIDGNIVGSLGRFEMSGETHITYWIDREYWGQGIATAALEKFLSTDGTRPIVGHAAFDNIASQKVMEHSGFVRIGSDRGFANARQDEIEEFIYQLS